MKNIQNASVCLIYAFLAKIFISRHIFPRKINLWKSDNLEPYVKTEVSFDYFQENQIIFPYSGKNTKAKVRIVSLFFSFRITNWKTEKSTLQQHLTEIIIINNII